MPLVISTEQPQTRFDDFGFSICKVVLPNGPLLSTKKKASKLVCNACCCWCCNCSLRLPTAAPLVYEEHGITRQHRDAIPRKQHKLMTIRSS